MTILKGTPTLADVHVKLSQLLTRAELLSITEGATNRIEIVRTGKWWTISDPDNAAYLFLPVSKIVGRTKRDAWQTLHCMEQCLFAVSVRHPEAEISE